MKTKESDIFPPGEPPAAAQPATERLRELIERFDTDVEIATAFNRDSPLDVSWRRLRDKLLNYLHPPASAVQPATHDGIRNDEASERKLEELAFGFHVGIEGEYGCPGISCPGVRRLVEKLRELKGVGRFDYVPPASAVSPTQFTREQIVILTEELKKLPIYIAARSEGHGLQGHDLGFKREDVKNLLDRLESSAVSPTDIARWSKMLDYALDKHGASASTAIEFLRDELAAVSPREEPKS